MSSYWTFFSKKETKPSPLKQEELIFLESELLRVESSLRSEIKDIWRVFNDQQAKTLKLEKARSMKFPIQEESDRAPSILERIKGRRNLHGNR